jgi:hypothetical protein
MLGAQGLYCAIPAERSLELKLLQQKKSAAAADAQASCLEKQFNGEQDYLGPMELPKEELTPFNKTMNYLDVLRSPTISKPRVLFSFLPTTRTHIAYKCFI